MIVKACNMDAHEDFTLTQNLGDLNYKYSYINIIESLIRSDLMATILESLDSRGSMPLIMEEYLFATMIPFVDPEDNTNIFINYSDDDNINSYITSVKLCGVASTKQYTYDDLIIRTICFNKNEFANAKHYFIDRFCTNSDNEVRKIISIYLDKEFKKSIYITNFVGDLFQNILYGNYEEYGIHINENSNSSMMPYLNVKGEYAPIHDSTGCIALPNTLTVEEALFLVDHIAFLSRAMSHICTAKEIKDYIRQSISNDCCDDEVLYGIIDHIYSLKSEKDINKDLDTIELKYTKKILKKQFNSAYGAESVM